MDNNDRPLGDYNEETTSINQNGDLAYFEYLKKENADTKEYISILMKELEDTKHQLVYFEEQTRKKKRNFWKGFAVFEMLCLLGAGIFLGVKYIEQNMDTSSKTVDNQSDSIAVEKKDESIKTYRYVSDLDEVIDETKLDTDFKLSIETLFGYEYLCFGKDSLKVYYRNEYDNDNLEGRYRIFIDNGTRLVEYDWGYDLSEDISKLCPVIGSYSEDGLEQLVLLEFSEEGDKLPSKISMIDTDTLMEYSSLNLKEQINQLFTFHYGEEQNGSNQVTNTLMTLDVNSANYTYYINKDQYVDAVYNDTSIMDFMDYATFEITENSITLNAPVYISEEEYLGEITSKIGVNEETVVLQEFKFGAYVEADYEDPENTKNITPRTTILGDRVTINGNDNRRYLIPIFENAEMNDKDFTNLKEENGLKVYYENGVKKSIMGIDVSKYQGDIDWVKVKASGVEYAIIRLGYRTFEEGTVELDPYYLKNVEGATKAGIPVGIYFFSQAVNEEEAIEEAELVLENIKEYNITYPIIFDSEVVTTYDARANNLSRQKRTDICIAFCEKIKASGYKPMIYSNTKWMIMGIDLERLNDYDKWFAYYGSSLTFPYQFDMLQYSDQGTIPGIDGNVDLDISFIDYSLE